MLSVLLPVLILALVILLLNHQAVISSGSYEEEAAPRLKPVLGSINTGRVQEKARLDFIVAGFPKCVSSFPFFIVFFCALYCSEDSIILMSYSGNHDSTLRLPAPQRDPNRPTRILRH